MAGAGQSPAVTPRSPKMRASKRNRRGRTKHLPRLFSCVKPRTSAHGSEVPASKRELRGDSTRKRSETGIERQNPSGYQRRAGFVRSAISFPCAPERRARRKETILRTTQISKSHWFVRAAAARREALFPHDESFTARLQTPWVCRSLRD